MTDIIENNDKILSYLPLTLDNSQKNNVSSFIRTTSSQLVGKNKNRTIDKCGIRLKDMKWLRWCYLENKQNRQLYHKNQVHEQ